MEITTQDTQHRITNEHRLGSESPEALLAVCKFLARWQEARPNNFNDWDFSDWALCKITDDIIFVKDSPHFLAGDVTIYSETAHGPRDRGTRCAWSFRRGIVTGIRKETISPL